MGRHQVQPIGLCHCQQNKRVGRRINYGHDVSQLTFSWSEPPNLAVVDRVDCEALLFDYLIA